MCRKEENIRLEVYIYKKLVLIVCDRLIVKILVKPEGEYQHLDHSIKKPLPPSTDYQQLDHGPRRPLPHSDDYQQLDHSTRSTQAGLPSSDPRFHQYDEPFTGPLYPSSHP